MRHENSLLPHKVDMLHKLSKVKFYGFHDIFDAHKLTFIERDYLKAESKENLAELQIISAAE